MLNKNRNNRASHFQPAWAKRISAECATYGIRPETVSIMCRDFGEKKMLFLLKKYAENLHQADKGAIKTALIYK